MQKFFENLKKQINIKQKKAKLPVFKFTNNVKSF